MNAFYIALVYSTISNFIAALPLSDEYSSIRDMIENAEQYFPAEHAIEEARRALQGNGSDMIMENAQPEGAGIKNTANRWPGYPGSGRIPFVIDRSVSGNTQLIYDAMNQIMRTTCLRFFKRSNEKDYIRIFKGNGCYSWVGRIGGGQDLSLGNGCMYIGTVVHELLHAVGFFHEHQRSDRDNYVYINTQNVQDGQIHNFNKVDPNNELIQTPFNYNSIMIYGNYAFSKAPGQLMTLVARNNQQLKEPYDKPGMDNTDILEVKRLYQCP